MSKSVYIQYYSRSIIRPPGEMASRLTTNQEIAGSTPAVVIAFLSEILLFILATNDFRPPKFQTITKIKGLKMKF